MKKEEFLKKFNISEESFNGTKLSWDELLLIRENYLGIRENLELTAKYIVDSLSEADNVHSIKYRIKDSWKLLDKIIRKTLDSPGRVFSMGNYREEITDLIGIRVLHLFKKDWRTIGAFIRDKWVLHEIPLIYIRKGDSQEYYEQEEDGQYEIKLHKDNYRSIHYLVESSPYKEKYIVEIQTRTIIEEAWGEIDHTVRYPTHNDEILLNKFLAIFNNLAGSADEMGSYVMNLKNELIQRKDESEIKINALQQKIKDLQDKIKQAKMPIKESTEIVSGLGDIGEYLKQWSDIKNHLTSIENDSYANTKEVDLLLSTIMEPKINSSLIVGNVKNINKNS